MKHDLEVRVTGRPQTERIVRCRIVSLREKLLTRLFGRREQMMILIPGPSVESRRMSKSKLLLAVAEDLRSLADSVQAVANAMLQNEPTVDAEPKMPAPVPKKELTLEEVRAVLGEKSRAGFTLEIQALLKKYGAPKLSGIDPKHYAALLKDVEVLQDAP